MHDAAPRMYALRVGGIFALSIGLAGQFFNLYLRYSGLRLNPDNPFFSWQDGPLGTVVEGAAAWLVLIACLAFVRGWSWKRHAVLWVACLWLATTNKGMGLCSVQPNAWLLFWPSWAIWAACAAHFGSPVKSRWSHPFALGLNLVVLAVGVIAILQGPSASNWLCPPALSLSWGQNAAASTIGPSIAVLATALSWVRHRRMTWLQAVAAAFLLFYAAYLGAPASTVYLAAAAALMFCMVVDRESKRIIPARFQAR